MESALLCCQAQEAWFCVLGFQCRFVTTAGTNMPYQKNLTSILCVWSINAIIFALNFIDLHLIYLI